MIRILGGRVTLRTHKATTSGQGRSHSDVAAVPAQGTELTHTAATTKRSRERLTVQQATDSTSTSRRMTSYSNLEWVHLE